MFDFKRNSIWFILAGFSGLIPTVYFIVLTHKDSINFLYDIFYIAHCVLIIFAGFLLRKGSKRGLHLFYISLTFFILAIFLPQPLVGESGIVSWSLLKNLFSFSFLTPFLLIPIPTFFFAAVGNLFFLLGNFIGILSIPGWKLFLKERQNNLS